MLAGHGATLVADFSTQPVVPPADTEHQRLLSEQKRFSLMSTSPLAACLRTLPLSDARSRMAALGALTLKQP